MLLHCVRTFILLNILSLNLTIFWKYGVVCMQTKQILSALPSVDIQVPSVWHLGVGRAALLQRGEIVKTGTHQDLRGLHGTMLS
jgi:hypothetical protein